MNEQRKISRIEIQYTDGGYAACEDALAADFIGKLLEDTFKQHFFQVSTDTAVRFDTRADFARAAMTGLLSFHGMNTHPWENKEWAARAIAYGDAVLAALSTPRERVVYVRADKAVLNELEISPTPRDGFTPVTFTDVC